MSRSKAKDTYTLDDLIEQTAGGVECRKDKGVIDEIPAAYKPIDEVMANQQDLVEVVATLKQGYLSYCSSFLIVSSVQQFQNLSRHG